MLPDEIKTKLGITDMDVHLSANGNWYWVNAIRTDSNGHRNTYTDRLELEPSQEAITRTVSKFRAWEASVSTS